MTENREETELVADTQHRVYRTVTLLGGTTINAENKLRNKKKENKTKQETGGSQQRRTPRLPVPEPSASPTPTPTPVCLYMSQNPGHVEVVRRGSGVMVVTQLISQRKSHLLASVQLC